MGGTRINAAAGADHSITGISRNSAHPLRPLRNELQRGDRAEGNSAHHRPLNVQMIEHRQRLLGVEVHPVQFWIAGLVAGAMAEKIAEHHAKAGGGEFLGQILIDDRVQQNAVH